MPAVRTGLVKLYLQLSEQKGPGEQVRCLNRELSGGLVSYYPTSKFVHELHDFRQRGIGGYVLKDPEGSSLHCLQ